MPNPRKSRRTLAACLSAGALACLATAVPAHASQDQESLLQDDPRIVFADSADRLDATLSQIESLGVDRIRVSVFWYLVAPRPHSLRRPSFGDLGAAWPGSYPKANWERYDRIAKLATRHGLKLLFTITGPAPAWATGSHRRRENVIRPKSSDFRDFVTAVGRRYSGYYPDDQPQSQKQPSLVPPLVSEPLQVGQQQQQQRSYLPRVDQWSIWNEPNFPSWLYPQRKRIARHGAHQFVPASPIIYRRLVEAGYAGLAKSTHASDVILIGETAPRGTGPYLPDPGRTLMPLVFFRELYCLTPRFQPFRGRAARVRGCPATAAARRRFVSRHPGLFRNAGWAHHPYSLTYPPTWRHPSRNVVPLGSLRLLTNTLDRTYFRWGVVGGLPVYITEYGYQTKPPDPYMGVSWEHQAEWMSWAEELTFRNPRVASFCQFLLFDDAPRTRFRPRDRRRWVTWQSGLLTHGGTAKPSLEEYKHPIHITPTRTRRGRTVRVFSADRPAPTGARIPARVEWQGADGEWQTLDQLEVTNERGYLSIRVRPPGSGQLRVLWVDPGTNAPAWTRSVFVRLR